MIISEIRRLAEEFPDRTSQPEYAKEKNGVGQPECIIGHALYNLGVSPEELKYLTGSVEEIPLPMYIDGPELRWLNEVQRTQDSGLSWESAVKEADKWYRP